MSTLRVDQITDEEGTGAPSFPNGLTGLADGVKPDDAATVGQLPAPPPELLQGQTEDPTSTVFGTVSGQRLAQGFGANEQQIGIGQTWQSPSRSAGTIYQNTTGKPIYAAIHGTFDGSTRDVQVSNDGSTWLRVGQVSSSVQRATRILIPDGGYYRVLSGASIEFWTELR